MEKALERQDWVCGSTLREVWLTPFLPSLPLQALILLALHHSADVPEAMLISLLQQALQ